jgi:MFS superfamily sulfate permease-like transporter
VASAMICDAVFYVIDFHELILLVRMRLWQDVALFLTIFFGTLQLGVDDSIFFALGGCMMLLVRSVAVIQPKIVVLGRLSSESVRLKSERFRKARELHEERKERANTTDRGDYAGSASLLDNVSSLFLLKKYESKHGRGAATLAASLDDADGHSDESGDQLSQLRPHARSVREQRFLGLSSSTGSRFSSLSSSMSSSIDATISPRDVASSVSSESSSSLSSSHRLAFEYVDITEFPQAQSVPGVLMVKLSGALNFATIGRIQLLFRRFLAPLEMDAPSSDEMGLAASDADDIVQLGNCKNSNMEDVAIDMVEVISLDGSAVSVFVSLLREAMLGGRRVCLGGLRENVLKLLLRIPEFRRIMRDMLYATLHEAVTALE